MLRRAKTVATQAVAAGFVGAIAAVALLSAPFSWLRSPDASGPLKEGGWTSRSRAPFVVTGTYDAEVSGTDSYFSWTGRTVRIRVPHLPSSRAHRLSLAVRSGRAPDDPPPTLSATVDQSNAGTWAVTPAPQHIDITIPAGRTRTLVVLDITPTFKPGSSDPRELGVMIDSATIAALDGRLTPGLAALASIAFAAFALTAGICLSGVTGRLAAAASLLVAVVLAWLSSIDAAFLGTYPDTLATLGVSALVAGSVLGAAHLRWPSLAGADGWGVAAGLALGLGVLKVALVWHPLAIVGDGIFQVHRAQMVQGGSYFFTSVTPRPFFEFPYAVALYVSAMPWWDVVRGDLDHLRLLRLLCIGLDACVGVALYGAVFTKTKQRATALLAATLWPFATAPMAALSNANLTNLFGQAAFAVGLIGFAWAAERRLQPLGVVLAAVLITTGFLSHFGTITVGLAILASVVFALVALGRPGVRTAGIALFVITIGATAIAWTAYYSHFMPVYRQTYERMTTEDQDDSSKVVAAPLVKLQRWWDSSGDDYGRPALPVLVLAVVGLALLASGAARSAVSLVLASWLVGWIALLALGVLTALTLRANLATAPAFVGLSAIAIAALARRNRAGLISAIVLTIAVAWDGARVAIACVRLGGS